MYQPFYQGDMIGFNVIVRRLFLGLNVTLLNRRGLLATLLGQMKKKQSGIIDLEMVLLAECLAAASRSSKYPWRSTCIEHK